MGMSRDESSIGKQESELMVWVIAEKAQDG
jgi:hypothetical protein